MLESTKIKRGDNSKKTENIPACGILPRYWRISWKRKLEMRNKIGTGLCVCGFNGFTCGFFRITVSQRVNGRSAYVRITT